MQQYIFTAILIFCTVAALLGLNFVLEKIKTKELQTEGLNFLQLTLYEFFQYLINIKQMVRNKCSIIDEFLCNKNIENIAEVFSGMDLALMNDYNAVYNPSIFGDTKLLFSQLKPGDRFAGRISFSVQRHA